VSETVRCFVAIYYQFIFSKQLPSFPRSSGLRGEPVQANSSQQMLDAARDYRIVVAMFNIVDVMPSVYGMITSKCP